MKVMPHWHPDTVRTVLVMSGTFYFAVGEQWDESKLKPYPAGTLYSEPAKNGSLCMGEGRRSDFAGHRDWADRQHADSPEA
jgi:hypothetical protein